MSLPQLFFGTFNAHKGDEVRLMLKGQFVLKTGLDFPGLKDAPEDGLTFQDNALAKARYYHHQTGLPCFADDSGLEVDALAGAPGIYSARYAGEHGNHAANNQKLLTQLHGLPNRKAAFRCVIAYIDAQGCEWLFEGALEGSIAEELSGTAGFGYDPLFIPAGDTRTLAEYSPEAKNVISHRGKAMQAFLQHLLNPATPNA